MSSLRSCGGLQFRETAALQTHLPKDTILSLNEVVGSVEFSNLEWTVSEAMH